MKDIKLSDFFTNEEINEMPMGVWYELVDFSDRDYGSDWGFLLIHDHILVDSRQGFSKIRGAGDWARKAKAEYLERKK